MNKAQRRKQAKRQIAAELTARETKRRESGPTTAPAFEIAPSPSHQGPSDEEVLLRAARKAVNEHNRQRAIGIYRELLQLNPGNVQARISLALVLEGVGDFEASLAQLERAHLREPDNHDILMHRGAIRGAAGRYGEAEQDLRAVLRTDPGSPEAHFQLGLLMSRRGLWREAIPYLRRAVELDSSRASAYYYLGEALNHVDDLSGALQCFQRAVELRPTHPKTLYGMGIVLDRLNRPEEAAQMYRRSRELTHP